MRPGTSIADSRRCGDWLTNVTSRTGRHGRGYSKPNRVPRVAPFSGGRVALTSSSDTSRAEGSPGPVPVQALLRMGSSLPPAPPFLVIGLPGKDGAPPVHVIAGSGGSGAAASPCLPQGSRPSAGIGRTVARKRVRSRSSTPRDAQQTEAKPTGRGRSGHRLLGRPRRVLTPGCCYRYGAGFTAPAAGRRTRKRLPCPGSLCTVISPWCAATSSAATARPIPEPAARAPAPR